MTGAVFSPIPPLRMPRPPRVPYDRALDVILDLIELPGNVGTVLEVSLRRYNGGKPKVQLNRYWPKKTGGRLNCRLGRVSRAEVAGMLPILARWLETWPEADDAPATDDVEPGT